MTPEEIRAEAVDRIAREMYEREYRPLAQSLAQVRGEPSVPEFDAARDAHHAKRHFRAKAEKSVDALGELLPTGRQSQYIGRGRRRRHRYVTDWTEDDA